MHDSFLRLPEVTKKAALSRSTIYAMIKAGDFPKPIPIGKRAVGFLESEIDQWIKQRVNQARKSKRLSNDHSVEE